MPLRPISTPSEPEHLRPEAACDVLDSILFPIFIAAFVGTLLVLDPIQRIALRIGRASHDRTIIWLNTALVLVTRLTLGTKIVVDGIPDLPSGTPYIIVSNHQSLFDIPILHTVFRKHRPRFIAKKELSHGYPSISINLREGLNGLIDRSNPRQAVAEIARVGALANEQRFAVVLFPEGTRAKDGELMEFRSLGFSRLLENMPDAPVLPVALDGAWTLATRRFGPIPRGRTIHVLAGTPIARTTEEQPKAILSTVHAQIRTLLSAIRENAST